MRQSHDLMAVVAIQAITFFCMQLYPQLCKLALDCPVSCVFAVPVCVWHGVKTQSQHHLRETMSFPTLFQITDPSFLAAPANFICSFLRGFPLFYFILGSACHKMAVGSNIWGEILGCIVVSASQPWPSFAAGVFWDEILEGIHNFSLFHLLGGVLDVLLKVCVHPWWLNSALKAAGGLYSTVDGGLEQVLWT